MANFISDCFSAKMLQRTPKLVLNTTVNQPESSTYMNCEASTSAVIRSMPSVTRSNNDDSPTHEDSSSIFQTTSSNTPEADTPKTSSLPRYHVKAKRDLRSLTEILLERQVGLVEEQLMCLQDIREEIKTRNNIERQKLEIKKEFLELKRKKYALL